MNIACLRADYYTINRAQESYCIVKGLKFVFPSLLNLDAQSFSRLEQAFDYHDAVYVVHDTKLRIHECDSIKFVWPIDKETSGLPEYKK
jgi:hypothetical protein